MISATELVPGDIINVSLGDNIPADIVLINTKEMKVNNCSLTGVFEELIRDSSKSTQNALESPNFAFLGTSCTDGCGKGIVVRTGAKTCMGQMALLSQQIEDQAEDSPGIAKDIQTFLV